ncbi:hypothetical protein [Paracoccus sulfuroxidans]|uniref:DUF7946 domain-containing protein n=1 Tax=Paracoccus sulfuroxidans TaxID=384678 RepID=A0A562NKX8_9RHOB|nr:hypothetical protein [Paracoccus sulfuroxidans]TWI32865.1 hypothetical protein IQ24_02744 [Paracoccus sulfuroxidans]
MPAIAEHRLKITYTGGLADQNSLPAYDGATSIDGMTRAIHIIMHAYMTGEVVTRATALKGASILLKPARQGSFIYDLVILMEANPATTGVAAALGGPVVYDFIKTAIKRATGSIDSEPETATLRNLYARREPPKLKRPPPDLDELAETLEGSLQDAHRPIGEEGTIRRIAIGTPRQELVTLDDQTKDWVNTREEAIGLEVFQGNVTRYNSISRNARAFVDQLGRVVPIRPDGDFPIGGLPFLTWSLHGATIGASNKLEMRARRVSSASGRIKRLLLSDCRRAPGN